MSDLSVNAECVDVGVASTQTIIQTGMLQLNLDTRTLDVNGQRVHLTGREYQILKLLTLKKGEVVTKQMFMDHLYHGIDEPELKIIDIFICKLRKKIAAATGGERCVETVWGRGYTLRDPTTDGE